MLKGKILLILPDQDFFSGKMQKDLIQLMHDPVIQYVSGGHLSTILKADDYVKSDPGFSGKYIEVCIGTGYRLMLKYQY